VPKTHQVLYLKEAAVFSQDFTGVVPSRPEKLIRSINNGVIRLPRVRNHKRKVVLPQEVSHCIFGVGTFTRYGARPHSLLGTHTRILGKVNRRALPVAMH